MTEQVEASISWVLLMREVSCKLPAVQSLGDTPYCRVHFADQESGVAGKRWHRGRKVGSQSGVSQLDREWMEYHHSTFLPLCIRVS